MTNYKEKCPLDTAEKSTQEITGDTAACKKPVWSQDRPNYSMELGVGHEILFLVMKLLEMVKCWRREETDECKSAVPGKSTSWLHIFEQHKWIFMCLEKKKYTK